MTSIKRPLLPHPPKQFFQYPPFRFNGRLLPAFNTYYVNGKACVNIFRCFGIQYIFVSIKVKKIWPLRKNLTFKLSRNRRRGGAKLTVQRAFGLVFAWIMSEESAPKWKMSKKYKKSSNLKKTRDNMYFHLHKNWIWPFLTFDKKGEKHIIENVKGQR